MDYQCSTYRRCGNPDCKNSVYLKLVQKVKRTVWTNTRKKGKWFKNQTLFSNLPYRSKIGQGFYNFLNKTQHVCIITNHSPDLVVIKQGLGV